MQTNVSNRKINPGAFYPSSVLLIVFIMSGILFQDEVGFTLNWLLYGLADHLGWYINLLAVSVIFIMLVFIIYRYGDIKIGGP